MKLLPLILLQFLSTATWAQTGTVSNVQTGTVSNIQFGTASNAKIPMTYSVGRGGNILHVVSTQRIDPLASSKSKSEFCSRTKDQDQFRAQLIDSDNFLSFSNIGGPGNMGTCWWHSRFTRNANYLAVYRPELPRPSKIEALEIIYRLRHRMGVVEIPGFNNLREFSMSYEKDILSTLEEWQFSMGVLGLGWTQGLRGNSSESAETMKKIMDKTYDLVVRKKQVTYQMLQLDGFNAHSWLVVDMVPFSEGGYFLHVVDSNVTKTTMQYFYLPGQESFTLYTGDKFTPVNFQSSEDEVKELIQLGADYCGGKYLPLGDAYIQSLVKPRDGIQNGQGG